MLESPVKRVTCSEGGLHQSFPRRAASAFSPSGSCQVLPGTGGFQPYLGKTERESAAFLQRLVEGERLQMPRGPSLGRTAGPVGMSTAP